MNTVLCSDCVEVLGARVVEEYVLAEHCDRCGIGWVYSFLHTVVVPAWAR